MVILIIMSVIAALFGSDTAIYQSSFVLPFDSNTYTITSPYGERTDPINGEKTIHSGIDVVPTSHNIVAIADGTVVVSDVGETNGEHIILEHKVMGQVYRSGYYHMKENSRTVKVGDVVKQGQQLGIMGSTGRSTGPHLHFELKKYSVSSQKFEFTDPSIVINNKISAKKFDLYDYTNQNNQNGNGSQFEIQVPGEKPFPPLAH